MPTALRAAGKVIGWLLAIGAIVVVVVFGGTAVAKRIFVEQHKFTASDILEEGWELDVTKPFPAVMGGTAEGTVGGVAIRATFFIGRANVNLEPGTSIRIELGTPGETSIVEIPYGKFVFDRTAASPDEATVEFIVKDEFIEWEPVIYDYGSFWQLTPMSNPRQPTVKEHVDAWPRLKAEGLDVFMQKYLLQARLYLTEEQYQAYFRA